MNAIAANANSYRCIILLTQMPEVLLLIMEQSKSESISHSVMSNSLLPYGLQPARLLCSQNTPCKNTGMGSHSLLQGIFPMWGSNPDLLHCRVFTVCIADLYYLNHQRSPKWGTILGKVLKQMMYSLLLIYMRVAFLENFSFK